MVLICEMMLSASLIRLVILLNNEITNGISFGECEIEENIFNFSAFISMIIYFISE